MRTILVVLTLICALIAEEQDIVIWIESDSSSHFDSLGEVTETPIIYTVISDDSSFIRTESTDTAEWKNGYFKLNFGPYNNELTYTNYYSYADSPTVYEGKDNQYSWQRLSTQFRAGF